VVCHPGEVVVSLSPCPGEDECADLSAQLVIQMHVNDVSHDAVCFISQSFASDAEMGLHPQEGAQEHLVAIDAASEFLSGLGEFQLIINQCHLLHFE